MAKKATITRTPDDVALAMAAAERELKKPPSGMLETVQISLSQITTRPELFQPRGFVNGALDKTHVKKLARRIATKGELDPPLVVKIGRKWICVDGHHRIAAYVDQRWQGHYGTVRCHWFAGSVRDAVDESVRRNETIKLEMGRGDRWEAAWQRVVLGWGSKSEIVRLTGVSDGLVAQMRRVVEAHKQKDNFGRELRAKLRSIKDATWSLAKQAYLNLTPAEWDIREAAAKLARALKNRMHGKLSQNVEVTALALAIYDPELPEPLMKELRNANAQLVGEDTGTLSIEADLRPNAILTGVPTGGLKEQLEMLRGQQQRTAQRSADIEHELRRRDEMEAEPLSKPQDAPSGKNRWLKEPESDLGTPEGT